MMWSGKMVINYKELNTILPLKIATATVRVVIVFRHKLLLYWHEREKKKKSQNERRRADEKKEKIFGKIGQ